MDPTSLKQIENLLAPIKTQLDQVSKDLDDLRNNLVDKSHLDSELKKQKEAIEKGVTANLSKKNHPDRTKS